MLKNNSGFSILIPDGGHPSVIDIVNCFSQTKGVSIYIMSDKKDNPIKYSRLIVNFSYYPKPIQEVDFVHNINKELNKHDISLVMPVYENAFRTIIKFKDLISHKSKLCILPTHNNFKTAINKGLLADHMKKNSIECSKSVLIKQGEKYINEKIKLPVIVKPTEGFGGGVGIHKFDNIDDISKFFLENETTYDYLIEEYIEGYDLGCNVLCENGDILAFTIQKGTLWSNKPFAPQIGLDFLYDDDLYLQVQKLMKSLNWFGVANVDIRFDENDSTFKILEINTRFWDTVIASQMAGINFPYLYAKLSLNENIGEQHYRHMGYLNFEGLKKKVRQNPLFALRFKYIFNNTYFKFLFIDPVPRIYIFIQTIKNYLGYHFSKTK